MRATGRNFFSHVVRDAGFKERVLKSFNAQPFMHTLGASITHIAAGEVDISVQANPALYQQNGYYHAGVTTSIADSAAGYAAFTLFEVGSDVLTTELKMNLINPAQGDTLVAKGRIVKSGQVLSIVRADVYGVQKGKEDTHVATGLMTMFNVRSKQQ